MKFVPRELRETADISRGRRSWPSALKALLLTVILFGVGYLVLGLAASLLARLIPVSWEARLFPIEPGRREDDPAFRRAEAIFERLARQEGLRPLPYRLFILDLPAPNAVAVPGGGVGVTRGLLEKVEGEAGLAMVLAHELGHHQHRHALERLGRLLLVRGAMALLFGSDGSAAFDAGLSLAESSHSRGQEREADAFGLRLVHQALGGTEGALEFFERVHEEGKESRWTSFLASHPLTEDRLRELRGLQERLEGR